MNLPTSRLFRACPACNGRGAGPLRALVGDVGSMGAPEWVPIPCGPCNGRGWVRVDAA